MIIYGTCSKTIAGKKKYEGYNCPNCDNTQWETFGTMKYFDIYWIPIFLISRLAIIRCTNCKATFYEYDKKFPKEIAGQIKSSIFNLKNTIPKFTGLIIIASLIIWASIQSNIKDEKEYVYLENPMIGDFYVVKHRKALQNGGSEYRFRIMKVKSVSKDIVELIGSRCTYSMMIGPRDDIKSGKADNDNYYIDETINIQRSGLKQMKKIGTIYSVERQSENKDTKENFYLTKPMVNDFYIVNLSKMFKNVDSKCNYSIMRVRLVSKNAVELIISKIKYNLPTGSLKDIISGEANKDSYYTKKTIQILISGLIKLKEYGVICSVERQSEINN